MDIGSHRPKSPLKLRSNLLINMYSFTIKSQALRF